MSCEHSTLVYYITLGLDLNCLLTNFAFTLIIIVYIHNYKLYLNIYSSENFTISWEIFKSHMSLLSTYIHYYNTD